MKCAYCGEKEVKQMKDSSLYYMFCDECEKETGDIYVPEFLCKSCKGSFYREYNGKVCPCGSANIVSHKEFYKDRYPYDNDFYGYTRGKINV